MVVRSRPNMDCAYFVANGRPVAPCVTTIPRSNRPEHTRTKATRSRWALSMPACILNTNPENGAASGRTRPSASERGVGAGASSSNMSSRCRTPKFTTAAPNSTGVDRPATKPSTSSVAPSSSSSSTSSTALR